MQIRSVLAPLALRIFFLAASASSLSAQQIQPAGFIHATSSSSVATSAFQSTDRSMNAARGIVGGILGGGIGFAAGFLGGAWTHENCGGEDCGLKAAIVGGTIAESVGLGLGAHYGARGRGNPLTATLTSTAIGVAGVAAAFVAEGAAPFIIGITSVVQLAVVLATER